MASDGLDVAASASAIAAEDGFVVDLAPFDGVIGVAPAGPGDHSTIPPRAEGGGNAIERGMTTELVIDLGALARP